MLSWGIYAVTIILSLYSFLLSVVIIIGHGIYIVATKDLQRSKTVISYILAFLVGIVAFLPWLSIMMTNGPLRGGGFNFFEGGLLTTFKHWAGNIGRVFLDLNLTIEDQQKIFLPLIIVLILSILFLIGYSIYFLCRQTSKRILLFVLVLIFSVPLALIPKGSLSSNLPIRYFIPSCLGIQVAVAYLLATKTTSISVKLPQQKLWQLAIIALVLMGVVSCALSSAAESWWNKQYSSCNPQVARIINQAKKPLIISDADGGRFDSSLSNIVSLSYLLNPKVQFLLVVEPDVPKIPDGLNDMFLFRPSETLRHSVEQKSLWKPEPVYKEDRYPYRGSDVCLWKLNRSDNSTKNL
jgi:uncharacterized membrane protein